MRRRRETLRPQDVGIAISGARRVRGLRREEVASLAEIGASWYSSLEQGNVARVGAKTLRAIAGALRLSEIEREYLFGLARDPRDGAPAERGSLDAVLAFIETLGASAAFLTTALSGVVAWNARADDLFAFSRRPASERNVLAMMVRDARMRAIFPMWRETLAHMIAVFRANSGSVGTSSFDLLVEELTRESRDFAAIWREHDVRVPTNHVCTIRHPSEGDLTFDFTALTPIDHPTYALVVLVPREPPTSSESTASRD